MTRDDAQQIQKLAHAMLKLPLPSDPAAKQARDTLAEMTQMSFLIIPAGPGKVSADDVRKAWPIAGDPLIPAAPGTAPAPAPGSSAKPATTAAPSVNEVASKK